MNNENIFIYSDSEVDELLTLLNVVSKEFTDFNNNEFLKNLPNYAYNLPKRLVRYLNEFKYNPPPSGYCLVSGLPVDDVALGPTPRHWQLKSNNDMCKNEVLAACLYATVLGDIFGWLTQQDGNVIHEVFPMQQHEHDQLGCGSKEEIYCHNEDAFHELRGDYLVFLCLRNHDSIPTMVSKPDYSKLDPDDLTILFEKHYIIKPDNSHKMENESEVRTNMRMSQDLELVDEAYNAMSKRLSQPEKIQVLFGSKSDPYLRIDPYFMDTPANPDAAKALDKLIALINGSIKELFLKPGDCAVLDNYSVVHGRRAFTPKYDGTDRWCKRINVLRDIRKCRHVLQSISSRVIY